MRIADDLRREIYSGTLAPGRQLPTLAELCERYGVAVGTASRATELLLREGLTVSKPGAGSYVRERPRLTRMVRSWNRAVGTGSPWRTEMTAAGREGSWRSSSSPAQASPAVAGRLHIAAGDRVMRTQYTFLLDGKPDHMSVSWEPLALTEGTDIVMPEGGPYAGVGVQDRMAAIGHAPDGLEEEISARTLTIEEAQGLGVHAGISCILIERTYYEGERPLETADILLPPHYRAVYRIPLG